MDDKALCDTLEQIGRAFGGTVKPVAATMTERVARELCRQHLLLVIKDLPLANAQLRPEAVDEQWNDYVERAQEIFRAMSVPTDEMLDDIEGWSDKDAYQDLETDRERFAFVWDTMLLTAEYELDRHELTRKARLAEANGEWEKLSPEERARRTGPTPF